MSSSEESLTLHQVAEELGVHYMTAYRYVRIGRLPSHRDGHRWLVRRADLAALIDAPAAPSDTGGADWVERLARRLVGGDEAGAWMVIEAALVAGTSPIEILEEVLAPAMRSVGDDWAAGALIQMLVEGEPGQREAFFSRYPSGWLATTSALGIDYAPLQRALAQQEFEQADRITSAVLRQLAGPAAVQRGYVYYSEVPAMASVDLDSLDRLWICYSRGRFGFTVQARLLAAAAGRWERLWPRLGWKDGSQWTRYPGGFQWTIEAPEGHMPLVNQLRGVRLMDALLQHPALLQRRQR